MAGRQKKGGGTKTPAASKSSGRSSGRRTGADTKLRTARGRGNSSVRWLQRQLKDPYVAAAKRDGYRSRAAYKLAELDDKFHFLKQGGRVLDLGAAPGGWSQVAVARVGKGCVVAVDIQEMEPIDGVVCLALDFLDADAPAAVRAALDGPADVVLSDMAAPATGHAQTDHLRIMALLEAAWEFAREVLSPGGTFIGKVLRGGAEKDLLEALKHNFVTVRHVKPPASRKESAEIYVVATGFRGRPGENPAP